MNNVKTKLIILNCFFFFLLIANSAQGQTKKKVKVNWGIDVFALDLGSHVTFNFSDKFYLGIEGEIGYNVSTYILAAGEHFYEDNTLFKFNEGDPMYRAKYFPVLGYGIFTRILNGTRFPIDIGFRREYFGHGDGGGEFDGIYTKLFWPMGYRSKGEKIRRKISGGFRVTYGHFQEYRRRERGIIADVWARIYLNYTKKQ